MASVNCLPRRLIVNRPSGENNKFKWDPFSRGIISYGSWGIRLHDGDRFIRSDQRRKPRGTVPPKFEVGDGPCIRPPNILRSIVLSDVRESMKRVKNVFFL